MKNNKFILILWISIIPSLTFAQLLPIGAQYFQNQYLGNPAMSGFKEGLHLNTSFSRQWSTLPGAPTMQVATIDNRSKRVGLGLNFYNDKAGLIKRNRLLGTYAYHLPLSDKQNELHFGLSLGTQHERLSSQDINGEASDISATRFNQRKAVLDGDFGLAYTTSKLTVQGSIPNMKNFLKRERYNTANWNTYFASISYKFLTDSTENAVMIEPKIVYRGVRAYDNILDIGFNLSFGTSKLQLMGFYHSIESISTGLALNFNNLTISSIYTSGTSALRGYGNGNFEVGLSYHILKKSVK